MKRLDSDMTPCRLEKFQTEADFFSTGFPYLFLYFFFLKGFKKIILLVVLSAHIERFSVSHIKVF